MEKLGFIKKLRLEGDNNIPDLSPYDKYSQFEAVQYSKPIYKFCLTLGIQVATITFFDLGVMLPCQCHSTFGGLSNGYESNL